MGVGHGRTRVGRGSGKVPRRGTDGSDEVRDRRVGAGPRRRGGGRRRTPARLRASGRRLTVSADTPAAAPPAPAPPRPVPRERRCGRLHGPSTRPAPPSPSLRPPPVQPRSRSYPQGSWASTRRTARRPSRASCLRSDKEALGLWQGRAGATREARRGRSCRTCPTGSSATRGSLAGEDVGGRRSLGSMARANGGSLVFE